MDHFHTRISPQEATNIWRAVRGGGWLDAETQSVIVHDLSRMRQRIGILQSAFPESTLHAIAIKANPLVEVLRVLVDCGAGLEAASFEEVQLALAAGCPPNKIVFDSPAKTSDEIAASLELGVHLNVDNFDELARIADSLVGRAERSSIGMRINPEVGAGSIAHTSVASVDSKFGVPLSRDRSKVIDAFARFPWLDGLHVHVGSQGCQLEMLCEAAHRVQSLRTEIERSTGRPLRWLNIGGGLPTRYRESDDPPSPHQYVERLKARTPELMGSDTQLVTEFGRCVHAGCGLAFSRVEYVRALGQVADERSMAVIHLGADFLLRPVYRSAEWGHEFLLLDSDGQPKVGTNRDVSIAGPLCFGGDIIAREILLPRPEPGDWIVIRDCGAYTLGMWSRHCSRGIPTVVGYDQAGETTLLRQAERPADIVRYWGREHRVSASESTVDFTSAEVRSTGLPSKPV